MLVIVTLCMTTNYDAFDALKGSIPCLKCATILGIYKVFLNLSLATIFFGFCQKSVQKGPIFNAVVVMFWYKEHVVGIRGTIRMYVAIHTDFASMEITACRR